MSSHRTYVMAPVQLFFVCQSRKSELVEVSLFTFPQSLRLMREVFAYKRTGLCFPFDAINTFLPAVEVGGMLINNIRF